MRRKCICSIRRKNFILLLFLMILWVVLLVNVNVQMFTHLPTSKSSRTYFLGMKINSVINAALNHISSEPRHIYSNKLVKENAWCPVNITINDTNLKMYTWDKQDQGVKKQSFILEGWPPGRSRDPRNYINLENFTVLDIDGCEKDKQWKSKTRVLIMQHSKYANFRIRQDNRDTWMKYTKDYPHIKVIFLVGRPPPTNKSQGFQRNLEKEHLAHCDLLQFDYIEHYNNNTLKQLHAMQYLYRKFGIATGLLEYVLRADDDVFLNIPLLDKLFFLKSSQSISKKFDDECAKRFPPVLGHVWSNAPVQRTFGNKFSVPKYMYSGNRYPTYIQGSAVIFPRWTIPCLSQLYLQVPLFSLEDVHTTGFLADICDIPRSHIPAFHIDMSGKIYKYPNFTRLLNQRIHYTYHYVDQGMKRTIYNNFLSDNKTILSENEKVRIQGFQVHQPYRPKRPYYVPLRKSRNETNYTTTYYLKKKQK